MKKRSSFLPGFLQQGLLLTAVMLLLLTATTSANTIKHHLPDNPAIEGRWDMTVYINGKTYPSWLEVRHSGTHTLVGRFVGTAGSARPISEVHVDNNKISFSIPPQWEQGNSNLSFEGTLLGDSLSGSMTSANGHQYSWTAVRAPALRHATPAWGKPIHLFSGTDMNEWHAMGENQWKVENGILRSPHSGANLVTNRVFTDFKLHIEFRYPKGSNSGVYLRGRYEVQIEDSEGAEPLSDQFSGVYGFLPPSEMVAKDAGEWQSYDITLVGRMVTVVANGVTVICNREIPGITGGAIDSNEGAPGPILIQGDHGPIDYRNVIITPAK